MSWLLIGFAVALLLLAAYIVVLVAILGGDWMDAPDEAERGDWAGWTPLVPEWRSGEDKPWKQR